MNDNLIDPNASVAPEGAMAPVSSAPVAPVAPMGVTPSQPVQQTPPQSTQVTPDEPNPSSPLADASSQFDQASAAKDPATLLDIARKNTDNPVGEAALGLANHLYKTSKEFDNLVKPIVDAGGPGTPDGNKAAMKIFQSSKPDYSVGQILMQYLIGDETTARNMMTGGPITSEVRVDKNGNQVRVWLNANGPMRARAIGDTTDMTEQEYKDRKVGLQKYEDTLTYLNSKKISEQNSADWAEKNKNDGLVETAYRTTIEPLAQQVMDDMQAIGHDVNPKQLAEISKNLNTQISRGSRSSADASFLGQQRADANINAGKDVGTEAQNRLGLPVGPWVYTAKGVENKNTKESYTYDQLNQLQQNRSNSNESQVQNDTNKSAMIKYLRQQGASADTILRVERIYTNGAQLGQSIQNVQGNGKGPKYLFMPNAAETDNPYAVMQGKMVQLMTNGKLLRDQNAYARSAYESGLQNGGIMPSPAQIEAGFSRLDGTKRTVYDGMKMTEQLLQESVKRQQEYDASHPQTKQQAVPVPQAQMPSIEAKAPPSPSVNAQVKAKKAELSFEGAPVNAPAKYEAVKDGYGRPMLDENGRQVYRMKGQ